MAAYNLRVEQGLQPSTPFINLYSTDTQELLLVFMNVGYLVIACALYLYMRKRSAPFHLRNILTIYNLVNVFLSGYVSLEILKYKFAAGARNSSFICNKLAPEDAGRLTWVFALYYLQKFFEFFDTYFFILRKSFRQVTFLHLFHHASLTVIVGSLMPLDFGGDMYFPILVNSLCHVAVYLHYFCTCLGHTPSWSRHLVTLQLTQFGCIFLQSLLALLEGPECGSPDFSKILMLIYVGSMLVLFSDFFIKRYILKQQAFDMCGVIKSVDFAGGPSTSQYHGRARLGPDGSATIRLPRHFREGVGSTMYVYQLTAVGSAMPNLYVHTEVCRSRDHHRGLLNEGPGVGGLLSSSSSKDGGGGGGVGGGAGRASPTSHLLPYYSFIVRGGRPNGMISWVVCCVTGDENVRIH